LTGGIVVITSRNRALTVGYVVITNGDRTFATYRLVIVANCHGAGLAWGNEAPAVLLAPTATAPVPLATLGSPIATAALPVA
jgi:hypothetical protein